MEYTLLDEVGKTVEATLIPPEVGELSGCGPMLVVVGEGFL